MITLGAQAFISSSYNKYTKVKLEKNITGQEVARQILDKHGLNNVNVLETDVYLTDHYDPKNKLIKESGPFPILTNRYLSFFKTFKYLSSIFKE